MSNKRKDEVEIVDNLEPGELELRKVFEDVTTKNVRTTIDFTQETRRMIRELQEDMRKLREQYIVQEQVISQLRGQLAVVQGKLYSNGSE